MISIVTATHNRADDYLPRAIESVQAQTFQDYEHIIVDDASTDDTESVVRAYMENDDRIKYIKRKKNHGTGTAPKNDGIKAAKYDWIAYLDDDVTYYPYHLDTLAKAIKNHPDIDFFYTDMMVDMGGKMEQGIAMDFDAQFLLKRNYIDTSVACHKKELAYNVGGWDETVKRFTDWNLWCRMVKWGASFKRIPIITILYYAHEDTQSSRTEVERWFDPTLGLTMFKPQFDPVGDKIYLPYLKENRAESNPKVAIFTLTYDRLDYTKQMYASLNESTDYPFDWFVYDNGSQDDTPKWLDEIKPKYVYKSEKNDGITKASNHLLDEISKDDYQIIIKVDNDCEFMTKFWLEDIVDLWKRNHKLYISPYPEGLVHNPGGAPRVGYAYIAGYPLEVTTHIGGLCAAIDSRAYDKFRWTDQFKHGNQDSEASLAFRRMGYMPCYLSTQRVMHMNTTVGQYKDYPDYFERRKKEKTEVA